MAKLTRKKLSQAKASRSQTNWAYLRYASDESIVQASKSDPDAPELSEAELRRFHPPDARQTFGRKK